MDPKRLTIGVIVALSLFLGASVVAPGATARDPSGGGKATESEQYTDMELSGEEVAYEETDEAADEDGDFRLCTRHQLRKDDPILVKLPDFSAVRKVSDGTSPWDRDRAGNDQGSDPGSGMKLSGGLWKDQSGKRSISPLDSLFDKKDDTPLRTILIRGISIVVIE